MNHDRPVPMTAVQLEDACLLGANYQVPVLWIALFRSADLTLMSVRCETDEGAEVIEAVPTLVTTIDRARSNYGSRSGALARILGAESTLHIREWEDFLDSEFRAPFLQLDLGELWMMYDPRSDFDIDLREWLKAVDSLDGKEWDNLSSQANLNDPDARRYGIRGFPWSAELQWS